ncbi:RING finger and SPRY domain-containing protein 1 [Tyrophagus putrescentiae]|nr:RING finger and SPRY domain-containing protein 1 [Tyrophagus putrescentiae]
MIQNDNDNYETIRYKFSISPPSFYFEVTIITVGSMKIGLALKQMDIKNVVGENALSIGIDGYNRCVWMHNKEYKFKTSHSPWNAGDIIGIYVDLVNCSIIFGINNEIIEIDGDPFNKEFIFSKLPCHVAATLWQYQQFFHHHSKIHI